MSDRLYSVEQVAERLGLHVRTIRNYVRDGRLAAVRIGKQYRIAHADLEAFTGRPVNAPADGAEHREQRAEVSGVVEVDAVDAATADRLTTALTASTLDRGPGGVPLRVQTVHDAHRARMKIIVVGGLGDTARLLGSIEGMLGS